jgi:hypothetical protein
MNPLDSIAFTSDSTLRATLDSLARVDSIARADSIFRADSIARADSIELVAYIKHMEFVNRGFHGIPVSVLPQVDSWVFSLLLVLFLILSFTLYNSSSLITETIKDFFQVKERSSIFSKTTINDFGFRYVLLFFSACVLSLYVYLLFLEPSQEFNIQTYLLLLLTTIVFLLLKFLLFNTIGYVFIDPKILKLAKDGYFAIIYFVGIVAFPIVILHLYSPYFTKHISTSTAIIIASISLIIIILKSFQLFFHKILAFFYILLYLCTLEIIPFLGLFLVYDLIV